MLTLPRLVGRGTWLPGRNSPALFTIQIILLVTAFTRSLDYLRGGRDAIRDYTLRPLIEAAPIDVWGLYLLAGVFASVFGLVSRHGRCVASGHMMLMAGYAAIAFSMFQTIGLGPGIRWPVGMAGIAVMHGALGVEIFAIVRRRKLLADTFHETISSRG